MLVSAIGKLYQTKHVTARNVKDYFIGNGTVVSKASNKNDLRTNFRQGNLVPYNEIKPEHTINCVNHH